MTNCTLKNAEEQVNNLPEYINALTLPSEIIMCIGLFSFRSMNFLRKLQNTAPGKKISSVAESMTSRFKGMYKQVTEAVGKSTTQPHLLPYIPQEVAKPVSKTIVPESVPFEEARKAERKAFKEKCAVVFNDLSSTLANAIETAEHEANKDRYKKIIDLQGGIAQFQNKGEQWKNLVTTYQSSLREVLGEELKLQEKMNRMDMQNTLLMAGYVRVTTGKGYAALCNTLSKEEQQYMREDGGTWILRDVWETAQDTNDGEAILHACWDQIEDGRTPILHMNRLMHVLGYEKARETQVQYTFARDSKAPQKKQAFAFQTGYSRR